VKRRKKLFMKMIWERKIDNQIREKQANRIRKELTKKEVKNPIIQSPPIM
jgi:hypothetical protein